MLPLNDLLQLQNTFRLESSKRRKTKECKCISNRLRCIWFSFISSCVNLVICSLCSLVRWIVWRASLEITGRSPEKDEREADEIIMAMWFNSSLFLLYFVEPFNDEGNETNDGSVRVFIFSNSSPLEQKQTLILVSVLLEITCLSHVSWYMKYVQVKAPMMNLSYESHFRFFPYDKHSIFWEEYSVKNYILFPEKMFPAQRNDKWEKYDDDLSFSNDLWCFISLSV